MQSYRQHTHLQTELATGSCVPYHYQVTGLHDLTLALELLLVL